MYFRFRLKDNLVLSENGTVYLSDIQKKLQGKFTGREIGRAVGQVFRGTLSKTVRNKEYWAKLTKQYFGVEWKRNTATVFPEIEKEPVVIGTEVDNNEETSTDTDKQGASSHPSSTNEVILTQSDHNDMANVLRTLTGRERSA